MTKGLSHIDLPPPSGLQRSKLAIRLGARQATSRFQPELVDNLQFLAKTLKVISRLYWYFSWDNSLVFVSCFPCGSGWMMQAELWLVWSVAGGLLVF